MFLLLHLQRGWKGVDYLTEDFMPLLHHASLRLDFKTSAAKFKVFTHASKLRVCCIVVQSWFIESSDTIFICRKYSTVWVVVCVIPARYFFSMINVSIKRPLGAHLNKTVNKSILSFFTRAFQGKRPSWNSGLVFFFSFGRKPQSSPHHAFATFWAWRMREVLTNEHTGWCNGGRRKTFAAQN